MGKYKLRHGRIQVRVLALTLLFTLGRFPRYRHWQHAPDGS